MPFRSTSCLKAIALTVLFATSQSFATPAFGDFVVKDSFQPPSQWTPQGRAPGNTSFVMRINLNQPNIPTLIQKLYAVSDPASSQYGKFLSKEDVLQLGAPSKEGLEAVNNWLAAHGFDVSNLQRSASNDSVKVLTTVSLAEKMLNTVYSVYKHEPSGKTIVRTNSWSVPKGLENFIDVISPTTGFMGQIHKAAKARPLSVGDSEPPFPPLESIPSEQPIPVDPACSDTITPACLFELYNATTYKIQKPNSSNIAITSYIGQFANVADFEQFNTRLRPEAAEFSFNVVSVNGGQNIQIEADAGTEADLDTQYAFSLSFPIPATVYTTGGSPPFTPDLHSPTNDNEPYLDWIDFILAQDTIPQTISTSYVDDEQTVPLAFAQKVCNGFAQIGARGVSLLFASGDFGVGDNDPDPTSTTCKSNDGKNRTEFLASFPASCPFVTTVGATVNVPETASLSFGSGGGFSNYFARPSYQDAAVGQYLNSIGNTYKGLFNASGRAYPDLAAMGDNYAFIFNGSGQFIAGTSAATATFGGIVALLNDARIAARLAPLGFLNPLLYSTGFNGLNDITVGSNPGCGTPGFNCTKGWDPVTGFGTPNFGLLKNIVLQGATTSARHPEPLQGGSG